MSEHVNDSVCIKSLSAFFSINKYKRIYLEPDVVGEFNRDTMLRIIDISKQKSRAEHRRDSAQEKEFKVGLSVLHGFTIPILALFSFNDVSILHLTVKIKKLYYLCIFCSSSIIFFRSFTLVLFLIILNILILYYYVWLYMDCILGKLSAERGE